MAIVGRALGQSARITPVRIYQVDVESAAIAIGLERDQAIVRAPRWTHVDGVTVGQLEDRGIWRIGSGRWSGAPPDANQNGTTDSPQYRTA